MLFTIVREAAVWPHRSATPSEYRIAVGAQRIADWGPIVHGDARFYTSPTGIPVIDNSERAWITRLRMPYTSPISLRRSVSRKIVVGIIASRYVNVGLSRCKWYNPVVVTLNPRDCSTSSAA